MKICFLIDSLLEGGAEKVVSILSNEMSKTNDVSIITFTLKDVYYPLSENVKLFKPYSAKLKRPISKVLYARKLIKKHKPDIVISFLPHIIIFGYFATRFIKTKFVVAERNDPSKMGKIFQLIMKFIFKKSDGCVFQTEDAQTFYGKKITNKSKIIFNPITLIGKTTRTKSNRTIVSVGRLAEQKNFADLIKAFKVIIKKYPDYILHIVGKGPCQKSLNNFIVSNNLSQNVFLVGPKKNWHSEYCNSAMFVSSSLYEGMPNALAEALLIGIPCVATDCPVGGSKLLLQNYPECLASIGDFEDLANKMLHVIESKFTVDQNQYANMLNPVKIARNWIDYLNEIVNRSKTK